MFALSPHPIPKSRCICGHSLSLSRAYFCMELGVGNLLLILQDSCYSKRCIYLYPSSSPSPSHSHANAQSSSSDRDSTSSSSSLLLSSVYFTMGVFLEDRRRDRRAGSTALSGTRLGLGFRFRVADLVAVTVVQAVAGLPYCPSSQHQPPGFISVSLLFPLLSSFSSLLFVPFLSHRQILLSGF